jgi:poly(3-hydroxybutyrate) depolymerase
MLDYCSLGFIPGVKMRRRNMASKRFTTVFEGVERVYYVSTPARLGTARWPLILSLHGSGGTGAHQDTLWGSYGRDSAILVFPSASRLIDGETHWLAMDTSSGGDPYGDERFLLALIDILKLNYNIDSTRIYLTGFSSGGKLTQHMAIRQGPVFAGFGVCGRSLTSEWIDMALPIPKPHIELIGTADGKDQWTGANGSLSGIANRDWWAGKLGQGLDLWIEDEVLTDANTNSFVRDYLTTGATAYRWIRVEGGGHRWFRPAAGDDIHASAEILSFFREHAGL